MLASLTEACIVYCQFQPATLDGSHAQPSHGSELALVANARAAHVGATLKPFINGGLAASAGSPCL